MGHIVLLGDSIFDNVSYVPEGPPVVTQLRQLLPDNWRASLLAVDGHRTMDVMDQLTALPGDATHLIVSVGGNDALSEISLLDHAVATVGDALRRLQAVRTRFQQAYHGMIQVLGFCGKRAAVCTVYDAVPVLGPGEQAALAGFNEVILREAFAAGLPVIDLRLVCNAPADYAALSPIEPSVIGGAKIARVIADLATTHTFASRRSTIYV